MSTATATDMGWKCSHIFCRKTVFRIIIFFDGNIVKIALVPMRKMIQSTILLMQTCYFSGIRLFVDAIVKCVN